MGYEYEEDSKVMRAYEQVGSLVCSTLYLSISLDHWLTLLDLRKITLLVLGCLILNQLVEESGGPEESSSEPSKADS